MSNNPATSRFRAPNICSANSRSIDGIRFTPTGAVLKTRGRAGPTVSPFCVLAPLPTSASVATPRKCRVSSEYRPLLRDRRPAGPAPLPRGGSALHLSPSANPVSGGPCAPCLAAGAHGPRQRRTQRHQHDRGADRRKPVSFRRAVPQCRPNQRYIAAPGIRIGAKRSSRRCESLAWRDGRMAVDGGLYGQVVWASSSLEQISIL